MPNWKKIIVSGSDAQLNSLNVTNAVTASIFSGSFSGSLFGTASWAQSSSRATTSSYALTASYINPLNQNVSIYGNLSVSGSTFLSASSNNIALQLYGSGSTIFSISGSSNEIFRISDDGTSANLFSVSSGSTTILSIDANKVVSISGSLVVTGSITGSLYGTASWATNALTASYVNPLNQTVYITGSLIVSNSLNVIGTTTLTGSLNSSGSNTFIGTQTVTGSLFTTGSNTLIGNTILSGSIGISGSSTIQGTTTMTGSLNITGSTTQIGNNTLLGNTTLSGSIIISGSNSPGSLTASVQIYGDIRQAGYHRFDPVTTNIDTSISASYIYVSGSTNDLYFSQNGGGYANTTRLRWLEGNLYTGLLNGGIVSQVNSNTYQISSGSGVVVDLNVTYNDDPYPVVEYLNWGNITETIDALSGSFDQQFVAISSSAGTAVIKAQGTPYVDGDYNDFIPIGIVLHQNRTSINGVQTFPGVAYGWKQRSFDFIKAFGALKISGYTLTPSASSARGLLLSGGTSWVDGRNYSVDPNTPSYIVEATSTTTSKIFRYYQSGSNWQSNWGYNTNGGAGFTDIDPTQYSNAGTLTTVPVNHWTIQRVFYFPNSATKALFVYYGNAEYANEAAALAAVDTETFTEAPNTAASAIYIGYMLLRHNADFTVPASYDIYAAGLFRGSGTGGGGGGGGGSSTLAGLTDVSITSPTYGDLLMYGTTVWNNTKTLSGSYGLSGSLTFVNGGITGSLFGTSSWAEYVVNGGGTPGGSNTTIQFNSNNAFSGSANFTFDSASNAVQLTGSLYIKDSANKNALEITDTTRALYNDLEDIVLDWETSTLYDNNFSESIAWNARTLYDLDGTDALQYTNINIPNGVRLYGTASFALTSSFTNSASYADTASLVTSIKSGVVSTFAGNPKTGSVTFTTAYANASYAVTVTGGTGVARSWTVESKTTTGFTINSNSNTAISGEVNWIAVPYNS